MFVRRVAIVGWNPFYKKANFLCPQGATCCWSGSTARKRHARRSTWSTWETEGTPWRTRPRSPASTCSSSSGARTISQEAPSTSLFPKSIWSHFRCRISRLKLSSLLRARSAYRLPDLIITVDNVCSFCTAMISKGTAWNLPETTASLLASCTAMPPCCCCSPCTILRVRKFIRAASYVVARHLARTLWKPRGVLCPNHGVWLQFFVLDRCFLSGALPVRYYFSHQNATLVEMRSRYQAQRFARRTEIHPRNIVIIGSN